MKPHYFTLLAISLILFFPMSSSAGEDTKPDTTQNVIVEMKTSLGDVTLMLDARNAPITVNNFLRYADEGFYNGTIFHRVIPGFMIQGGGFDAKMQKLETHQPIKNEASNGLQNLRGTISMARTNVIDSATAQFFINTADNPSLDHKPASFGYAVFGKVIQGSSIIQGIEAQPTSRRGPYANVPVEPITIISMQRVNPVEAKKP